LKTGGTSKFEKLTMRFIRHREARTYNLGLNTQKFILKV
jgi:hypothetical protein